MLNFLKSPRREYLIIILVAATLAFNFIFKDLTLPLALAALLGALSTFWGALGALKKFKINIETFNALALLISLLTREFRSAAFIVLMLAFAALLDWHTSNRAREAIGELLKLKPQRALREKNGASEEILTEEIGIGDIILSKQGSRIAADGKVVFGSAYVNEAAVTGESLPKEKIVGDEVLSGTLNESGVIKFKVTASGKESTLERIAALIAEASRHKSRRERLADKFASVFLPVVLVIGFLTYLFTKNLNMTAAVFLVACADDMAVAIPLAMMAALGRAAKRGVIVKGGEWLDALARARVLILDKTGTLTYGEFSVENVEIKSGIDEKTFWRSAAQAEKFSEHPIGRAIFKAALKKIGELPPDPEKIRIIKGGGVWILSGSDEILMGNKNLLKNEGVNLNGPTAPEPFSASTVYVALNKNLIGRLDVADIPRSEAKESLDELKKLGFSEIAIFTGDNEAVAKKIGEILGISNIYANMSPAEKLSKLEMFSQKGPFVMVGDGINDAPALARADVGVAMGGGGTAVAVEAADVVILTDNLSRLPEMVSLSRKTSGVITGDMVIWLVSNLVGFALVFTGIAGPALAAFYNFATDFFPLINSARIFRV